MPGWGAWLRASSTMGSPPRCRGADPHGGFVDGAREQGMVVGVTGAAGPVGRSVPPTAVPRWPTPEPGRPPLRRARKPAQTDSPPVPSRCRRRRIITDGRSGSSVQSRSSIRGSASPLRLRSCRIGCNAWCRASSTRGSSQAPWRSWLCPLRRCPPLDCGCVPSPARTRTPSSPCTATPTCCATGTLRRGPTVPGPNGSSRRVSSWQRKAAGRGWPWNVPPTGPSSAGAA